MFENNSTDEQDWYDARKRNLLINIAKVQIKNKETKKKYYTADELKDLFAFKLYDLHYVAKNIFTLDQDQYSLNNKSSVFFKKVMLSNDIVKDKLTEAESFFIRVFGHFLDEMNKEIFAMHNGKFEFIFKQLSSVIQIIHWARLPVFNEHLLFSRKNPELETLEFYGHLDCLKALLREVRGEGIVMSNKSDLSLNRKIEFSVYTRRWGHFDHYSVSRTINGWNWTGMMHEGESDKEGLYLGSNLDSQESSGPLFDSLNHDSVFFPEDAVKFALAKLWEDADEGKIDYDELSNKLQEIAEWISSVEKNIGEAQPKWLNYY